MNKKDDSHVTDPEINAISIVHNTLKPLDTEARVRVLRYVAGKLGIVESLATQGGGLREGASPPSSTDQVEEVPGLSSEGSALGASDEISPIAQKWMSRNGLSGEQLGGIFSLGGDEIDLVARSVPGKSKREKMRHVILLKGVAAYLGSGAARVSYQQIKETCVHYNAYDSPNFAKHLKGFAADVSGTKESGYTLTARGLASATNLIKRMTQAEQGAKSS